MKTPAETLEHYQILNINSHVADPVVVKLERSKSQCKTNKVCERCFLCRSVEFGRHKYPSCCSESGYRVQTTPILGNMGCPRDQS